jgi:hypothetical protein
MSKRVSGTHYKPNPGIKKKCDARQSQNSHEQAADQDNIFNV